MLTDVLNAPSPPLTLTLLSDFSSPLPPTFALINSKLTSRRSKMDGDSWQQLRRLSTSARAEWPKQDLKNLAQTQAFPFNRRSLLSQNESYVGN